MAAFRQGKVVPRLAVTVFFVMHSFVGSHLVAQGHAPSGSSDSSDSPIERLRFADPAVKKHLRRPMAVASKHMGEDSQYRVTSAGAIDYSRVYCWKATWSRPADAFAEDRLGGPPTGLPGRAGEYAFLGARTEDEKTAVQRLEVVSLWTPAGAGWQCGTSYHHPWPTDSTTSKFNIRWTCVGEEEVEGPRAGLNLQLAWHLSAYADRMEFGGTTYEVYVACDDARGAGGLCLDADEIRRWYASPESLRHAALARLKAIRTWAERGIESRKYVRGRIYARSSFRRGSPAVFMVGQARPAHISLVSMAPAPMPSGRELADEEAKELIARADAELDARTALIREHYREMHAALLKTIPLPEALDRNGPPRPEKPLAPLPPPPRRPAIPR